MSFTRTQTATSTSTTTATRPVITVVRRNRGRGGGNRGGGGAPRRSDIAAERERFSIEAARIERKQRHEEETRRHSAIEDLLPLSTKEEKEEEEEEEKPESEYGPFGSLSEPTVIGSYPPPITTDNPLLGFGFGLVNVFGDSIPLPPVDISSISTQPLRNVFENLGAELAAAAAEGPPPPPPQPGDDDDGDDDGDNGDNDEGDDVNGGLGTGKGPPSSSSSSSSKRDSKSEISPIKNDQKEDKKTKRKRDDGANKAERKLEQWVRSVVGSSGLGGSGVPEGTDEYTREAGEPISIEFDGNGQKRRTKRRQVILQSALAAAAAQTAARRVMAEEGGKPTLDLRRARTARTESHFHAGRAHDEGYYLQSDGENLDEVMPFYVAPGVWAAVSTVYSKYQQNARLKNLSLKELVLGDDMTKMAPDTRASQYFRLVVIEVYKLERYSNSQRMRSVAGAKAQSIVVSRLFENIDHSCGMHYQ